MIFTDFVAQKPWNRTAWSVHPHPHFTNEETEALESRVKEGEGPPQHITARLEIEQSLWYSRAGNTDHLLALKTGT